MGCARRPPYESFRLACERTFLAPQCARGDAVALTLRTSDGRTFAQTVPAAGGDGKVLLRGAYITGPAGTPLGFYRVLPDGTPPAAPPPPNLAPDPLQTIATVTADSHAYDVALAGQESVGERRCYRLKLRPRRDPERYPLRDLWVDETTYEVVQLAYERPYDEHDTWASVRYRFAPVGPANVWTIVHVEAAAPVRGFLGSKTERVADDLHDIAFPPSAPDWYFEPGTQR